jgi:hypothetical protein
MAENKKSFIAYADWITVIKKLVLRDREKGTNYAGELFLHILEYVNDNEPIPIDFIIEMAFEPIKLSLKRDLEKYEKIRQKRSEAGKASADKRQQKATHVESVEQTSTNQTVSVNDSVSVSDNVNEENKRKGVNPSFSEVEIYGKEKGYDIPVQKIIDHYTNGGELNYWIDAKNKKVIRWKSKISSVWFKDEYKIIEKKLSLNDFKIPNADLYGWGDKKCLEMALNGEYPRK